MNLTALHCVFGPAFPRSVLLFYHPTRTTFRAVLGKKIGPKTEKKILPFAEPDAARAHPSQSAADGRGGQSVRDGELVRARELPFTLLVEGGGGLRILSR